VKDTHSQTILVVDDSPENIDILVSLLEDDYMVKAAISGEEALKVSFLYPHPDLVLLDIVMEGMDGYEVISRLKADPRTINIPVIFLTSKTSDQDETKGLDLGAVDYILKPFSPSLVKRRVRTQLALYDRHRELEREVSERTAELAQTQLSIIRRLGRAAEFKDNETGLHVIRMSHYARIVATELGMTETETDRMLNAAPMHDVGKMGISDQIMCKPTKLDEGEWIIMRKHPAWGVEIIGDCLGSELLTWASCIALTHHEKWNGTGYPNGISGETIPLIGRIVAVADVFDALTSVRPYKEKWSVDDTMLYFRKEAGAHFDPALVNTLERCLPSILQIMAEYAEP
jgi:putative two-component system response regulator